jgi:hypothetical protein
LPRPVERAAGRAAHWGSLDAGPATERARRRFVRISSLTCARNLTRRPRWQPVMRRRHNEWRGGAVTCHEGGGLRKPVVDWCSCRWRLTLPPRTRPIEAHLLLDRGGLLCRLIYHRTTARRINLERGALRDEDPRGWSKWSPSLPVSLDLVEHRGRRPC